MRDVVGGSIAALLIFLVVATVLQFTGYASFSYFAPKYQEVKNRTFKESQAYNDGMTNDLADLRLQYLSAKTPEQKDAIRAIVLQRFASYPKDRLPTELVQFYASLGGM